MILFFSPKYEEHSERARWPTSKGTRAKISAKLMLCELKLLWHEKATYFARSIRRPFFSDVVRWERKCALWRRGGGKEMGNETHQAPGKS